MNPRTMNGEESNYCESRPRIVWARPIALTIVVTLLALLLVTASLGAIGGKTQPATTFSGRAIGVFVKTPVATLRFADTGPLPSKGGEIDATVLTVNHQLVRAEVLLSVTMGFDQKAQSDAAVASVTLLPGTATQITADFVRAQSIATCAGVSGSSEIVNLQLGGQQVVVSGEPNQMVTVPGILVLVINEQQVSSGGGVNAITVNALHLTLLSGAGEVIVSSAHSDIKCGGVKPVKKDFMTGGGFIIVNGAHANFGFVAGFKPGKTTVSGQLVYIDHGEGMKLKATSITSYSGSGTTRTFSGQATVNGVSGFTFTVTATDNGEPGRGADKFRISVSNGYEASGVLAGGNIQLHA